MCSSSVRVIKGSKESEEEEETLDHWWECGAPTINNSDDAQAADGCFQCWPLVYQGDPGPEGEDGASGFSGATVSSLIRSAHCGDMLWHQRLIGCFNEAKQNMCYISTTFLWKQGDVGLAGDPGELGQLGLKVNCCLGSICLNRLLNSRTKWLFHPRTCCLSLCPQGDVGMEGPRGGVGVPGEPVRKHHPHNLISFPPSLQLS